MEVSGEAYQQASTFTRLVGLTATFLPIHKTDLKRYIRSIENVFVYFSFQVPVCCPSVNNYTRFSVACKHA